MSQLKQLHDQDYNLWLEQMARAIKNRDVKSMDWDGLLESIEDMGASERRALRSYIRSLIDHILKLKYWDSEKEPNRNHWEKEVVNFRDEVKQILKESPSLKNYLHENYQDWYANSVKAMKREFDIPNDSFVSWENIMKEDYFGS
ncbi:MAG: DUF29 domain-containing protein [Xenococcaceae cyanobacterium MO_207.B15]|nr:DUF29 domain-containing protein [Xenococcaceae cyanobacterium MO_207.B15]